MRVMKRIFRLWYVEVGMIWYSSTQRSTFTTIIDFVCDENPTGVQWMCVCVCVAVNQVKWCFSTEYGLWIKLDLYLKRFYMGFSHAHRNGTELEKKPVTDDIKDYVDIGHRDTEPLCKHSMFISPLA